MMNNVVPYSRKLSLEEIVSELGIKIGEHPRLFTQCFAPGNPFEEKILSKTSSGLSRVLKNLLPQHIDGFYEASDDLVKDIINDINGKFYKCKAVKEIQSVILKGIRKAIGFQIVKYHPETSNHPTLSQIRQILLEHSAIAQTAAKGSHKGANTEEVQETYRRAITAAGDVVIPGIVWGTVIEYCTHKMINGDEKAGSLLKQLYYGKDQKLLTA